MTEKSILNTNTSKNITSNGGLSIFGASSPLTASKEHSEDKNERSLVFTADRVQEYSDYSKSDLQGKNNNNNNNNSTTTLQLNDNKNINQLARERRNKVL